MRFAAESIFVIHLRWSEQLAFEFHVPFSKEVNRTSGFSFQRNGCGRCLKSFLE